MILRLFVGAIAPGRPQYIANVGFLILTLGFRRGGVLPPANLILCWGFDLRDVNDPAPTEKRRWRKINPRAGVNLRAKIDTAPTTDAT